MRSKAERSREQRVSPSRAAYGPWVSPGQVALGSSPATGSAGFWVQDAEFAPFRETLDTCTLLMSLPLSPWFSRARDTYISLGVRPLMKLNASGCPSVGAAFQTLPHPIADCAGLPGGCDRPEPGSAGGCSAAQLWP